MLSSKVQSQHYNFRGFNFGCEFRKARLLERQEKGGLGRRQHALGGGGGGGGGGAKSRKRGKGFVVVSEQCRVGEKILELCEFRAALNRDAERPLHVTCLYMVFSLEEPAPLGPTSRGLDWPNLD